ncbi:beta-L-arabinofuranosidase domain-containing protein [Curtobacterium sp. MCBD17_040]|uniref:glycoside hydrolase family 127 protein n=1 Tax=Curtobacterium sp. MCBD17_040 TaxID=2175674 RepID=UPI000DAA6B48|nr:beta-L-arabinofuranosidase domain-containing protein [Curtobacterium sp. MCBD17_040]WIB65543.1 glycoside hydrolase family 127 protein [Curtobacterium sp. MCBD17_040]
MHARTTTSERPLVLPTAEAAPATFRPLRSDAVRITDEFWTARMENNRTVSLPEAYDHLEEYGGLAYLRAAANGEGVPTIRPLNDPHVVKILDSDVYKWVEAVAEEHMRQPLDDNLLAKATDTVDLIVRAQQADGSVHSWTTVQGSPAPLENWREGHELYCGGHLVQTAVAWARATGDDRLVDVAGRFIAFVRDAIAADPAILPLHPGLEMGLVELYRETGEREHLELAKDFIDRRGHNSFGLWRFSPDHFADHQPLRGSQHIQGHAVMAFYLLCGTVDVAVETGDAELLAAAERQWEDFVTTKMYLTGGAGSRQHDEAFGAPFELSPDTAYAETCAAIGSVMLSWRLLLATGRSRYADLIERTLYNGLLSGGSLDGSCYLYVNPLYVREPGRILSPDGYDHRKTWFECACCPPNLMRIIATVGQITATGDEHGIQLHQLVTGSVEDDHGRSLRVTSGVPFADGEVRFEVVETGPEAWTLAVRVPEWTTAPTLTVGGGSPAPVAPDADGYLRIERTWTAGDTVVLRTAPEFAVVRADPRIDAYRGERAVVRGPIVYCVEGDDLDGATIDAVRLPADVDVRMVAYDWLEVPAAEAQLSVVTLPPVAGSPYTSTSDADRESSTSRRAVPLIPYFAWGNRGATTMRVWLPEEAPGAILPA